MIQRMNLEDIKISEINQSQKEIRGDVTYMRYQIWSNPQRQKEWWLSGAGGERTGEFLFNGYRVQFGKMKKSRRWRVMPVTQ